jgi:hypothetical protein
MAEALLPSTDAIPRATLEWKWYGGKQLIRYRDADGVSYRCLTADRAEAEAKFNQWYGEMASRARGNSEL